MYNSCFLALIISTEKKGKRNEQGRIIHVEVPSGKLEYLPSRSLVTPDMKIPFQINVQK